ncbi:putative 6-phosphogluconolactonase/glucosamine-6-phosphate isomerase/deaminase [Mycobacterium ulcerans str. Harvey]|uniref:6-phosphogluconolactonase/glucosamine-6-phosphate isomerase/deaminase n=1 Tax=Mycobacterium ulcerans str. Harvey TaxID=1299332 RepID=A0ABP3AP69_MYCUL|nr:putative 6-phosphogluconolactonase/glucosamine-6-phosphate isomerase/deaminase [Mycobacterium ulcerans str. Harvey]
MIDGTNHLLRIAHAKDSKGCWQLSITESTDVSSAIPAGDQSVGVVPDYLGNVWFATGSGVVGVAKVGGGVASVQLDPGEQVANSISASPANRVGVATTAALYELNLDGVGNPQVLWRQPYDRGPARKPGQLSWGTGSTPTYFGPTGADYLTIVDNGDPLVHALIYESGTGNLICQQPVLTQGGPGSENSPIGAGTSTFIASTYGYPYPAVPAGAGPRCPDRAVRRGMTRVDVEPTGCRTVWDSSTRSAALPHLSIADGLIYTITRIGLDNTTRWTSSRLPSSIRTTVECCYSNRNRPPSSVIRSKRPAWS